ncbi:MAG: hypothetical protein ACREUO_00555 [Burkholderiales bacterium]
MADGVYAAIRADSSANVVHGNTTVIASALRAVQEQTEAAKAKGLDLEQTRKAVDVTELGRRFTGDAKVRRLSWENYFVGLAVQRAFEQAGAGN